MPRQTLFDHPKFQRLCYILQLPEPYVLGHLEYIWRVGYQKGDPVIGDELDVEINAKWQGERGVLVSALLETRFIDRQADGKLAIHDLDHHAPDYVKARARMEQYRKRCRNTVTPEYHSRRSLMSSENGYVTDSEPLRNGYHSPVKDSEGKKDKEEQEQRFNSFWEAYPNKKAKAAARKAWDKLRVDDALLALILTALQKHKQQPAWTKDGGAYIPHPATWLNGRRWEDDLSEPLAGPAGHPGTSNEEVAARILRKRQEGSQGPANGIPKLGDLFKAEQPHE